MSAAAIVSDHRPDGHVVQVRVHDVDRWERLRDQPGALSGAWWPGRGWGYVDFGTLASARRALVEV